MRFNRKYLWSLGLLAAAALVPVSGSAAPYQGGYGGGTGARREGPMSPDQQVKQMTKMLDLTADQQAKLKPVLADERKKIEDVRNDSSLDRRTMRDKMMKIRQDTNDQVRSLLDDQQKEKFDKMLQERQDRMQNRRDGGAAAPGGDNQKP